MQPRAVLVTRLSRMTDATTSPESQRSNAEDEAHRQGATVVGHAEDLDVSASRYSPWDRPELGHWLARPDAFDMLIFRSVDRVARNVRDFVDLLTWSDKHEIRLVCLSPNVDFSSGWGKAIGILLATFAEMEADNIRTRVSGARAYMRSAARWGAGRVPYGYRLTGHPSGTGYALEPEPEQAELLREAAARFLAGESTLAIVREWNDRGIPCSVQAIRNRTGKESQQSPLWHVRTLDFILRSPSMRNVVHTQGRIQRDDDGQPLRYGEGILTDDEHAAVLAEVSRRASPRERKLNASPLLGVLYCATCHSRMHSNTHSGYTYYRCTSRSHGVSHCPGASVLDRDAEAFVEAEFLRHVGDWHLWEHTEDPGEDHSGEIRELESALEELETDRYELGLFGTDAGKKRYAAIHAKLEGKLEGLRSMPARPPGVHEVDTGITYAHQWEVSTPQDKRRMLMGAGVVVRVTGKASDGPPHDRLEFSFEPTEEDFS